MISAQYTVWCDDSAIRLDPAGPQCPGWFGHEDTRKDVWRLARRAGWKLGPKGERHLCPAHARRAGR